MRHTSALCALLLLASVLALCSPAAAQVSVGVSVRIGPPPLPVYVQPLCPGEGYIWVPGYWAWGPDDYFWVPGTWVLAPRPGLLWTPGWWGWGGGVYVWHPGYWGPHVGFYGGINYGFGYVGVGYVGGYWRGRSFVYNRAVSNVNVNVIHNTYNQTVVNNNVNVTRVSYNGGEGGVRARPSPAEESAGHEQHFAPTAMQTQHEHGAGTNRAFRASENHGQPPVAATARPGEFSGRGAVPARPVERTEGRPAAPSQTPRENVRPNRQRPERPAERAQQPPAARPQTPRENVQPNQQRPERPAERARPDQARPNQVPRNNPQPKERQERRNEREERH